MVGQGDPQRGEGIESLWVLVTEFAGGKVRRCDTSASGDLFLVSVVIMYVDGLVVLKQ